MWLLMLLNVTALCVKVTVNVHKCCCLYIGINIVTLLSLWLSLSVNVLSLCVNVLLLCDYAVMLTMIPDSYNDSGGC